MFEQILPQKNGEMNGDRKGPQGQMEERKVILTGSAESQWKVGILCLFVLVL